MALGQEGHPRGARLPPSAPDGLWAAGRGVRHQGQNHPGSRKLPSRWKRPVSEKSGLEGDAHRMCLSGTGTARSRRRAPPLTSGQRHSTGAAPGSGSAGWPSPEVLQSLGCPPQGEGCGHGVGPSCRQKLAPAFSPGGRVRRSRHAAATSLCPLPWRGASICRPGSASLVGVHRAATVSRALGAGATGPQRPGLRLMGRPGGLCPHGSASTSDSCPRPAPDLERSLGLTLNHESPLLCPVRGDRDSGSLPCLPQEGDTGSSPSGH